MRATAAVADNGLSAETAGTGAAATAPWRDAAYGSQEELTGRLVEVLAFAERTVEGAAADHALWDVDLGHVTGFDKMLLEASLLGLLADRGPARGQAQRLVRAIRGRYDSARALGVLARQPQFATTVGTALVVLQRFGLTSDDEDAALDEALASPWTQCSERVPFRLLDRQWVLHVAGRGPLLDEPALAVSAACRTSTPLYMSREDGYALTHAVMYATDFGAQSCPPALQSDELWATTDACLAWCLGSADYDLVAELLLTQLLLRRRLSAYGLIAWRCCTAAWDQLGFLPSPSLAPDTFEGLTSHSEGVQYAFHHMYHTIFVAGLLCNALLSLDVLPPEPLPAPLRTHPEAGAVARGIDRGLTRLGRLLSLDVDAARELTTELSWVADDGRRTAWAGEWGAAARRPGAARPADRAVRAMATDALMLAGARSFELSEVAAALRHAARDGLTPSAWVSAAFLARQEVFRAPPDGAYEDGMRIAGVLAAFTSCLVAVHDQSITESEDESRGPSAA